MRDSKVSQAKPYSNGQIEKMKWNVRIKNQLFGTSTKDGFMKQMWPLLVVYRLLCRFPFRRTPNGTLEMKMLSFQTVYFAIGFIGLTYLVLDNTHGIINLMFYEEQDFAEIVTGGLCLCILAIHLFVPFSVVNEWKLLCEQFNKWNDFQDRYREIMRVEYKPKLNLIVKIISVIIPVATFSLTVAHSSILYHKQWYHLLSYILVIMSVCILYAIWIISLIEIIAIADNIRARCFEVIELPTSEGKSHELYGLRMLWHELSIIVRFSASAVAYSMIFTSATGIVIFIASAYGFMQCVTLGDERYVAFFSVMVAMGLVLCFPCEFGYRTTLHVGTYIVEMLSSVNLMEQDELTAQEVDLFLQAVYSNYPDVSYAGMVKINRQTITSLFSATLTYLIVLLQLRIRKEPEHSTTTPTIVQELLQSTVSMLGESSNGPQ